MSVNGLLFVAPYEEKILMRVHNLSAIHRADSYYTPVEVSNYIREIILPVVEICNVANRKCNQNMMLEEPTFRDCPSPDLPGFLNEAIN